MPRAQPPWPTSRKLKRKPRGNARLPPKRSARKKSSGSVCSTSSTRCSRPRTLDRGLVVSMPDVLFDYRQLHAKPAARERLARISGIVLAYPDLRLEIEGHTDSVGSDAYNQTLSEKRAASVRDYLVNNGVSINNVIARGFGKDAARWRTTAPLPAGN